MCPDQRKRRQPSRPPYNPGLYSLWRGSSPGRNDWMRRPDARLPRLAQRGYLPHRDAPGVFVRHLPARDALPAVGATNGNPCCSSSANGSGVGVWKNTSIAAWAMLVETTGPRHQGRGCPAIFRRATLSLACLGRDAEPRPRGGGGLADPVVAVDPELETIQRSRGQHTPRV